MDTGDIGILIGIGFANVTILTALFALMWQTRNASRADANESRAEMREFRAEMREQGERLSQRISDAEREMREQGAESREQSERLSQRISDAEREQARLEGVNSVLRQHTHTHESAAD